MTDTSPGFGGLSPQARRLVSPGWLDLRLISGVLLVLVSVVAGGWAFASADHRQARWVLTRDLSAGTVLSAADLRAERVQLGSSDREYLPVTEAVVGRAVQLGLHAGQLLPRAALTRPQPGVAVTIPLRADNGPSVTKGERITVWLSSKTCQGQVLLSGVPVQSVSRSDAGAFASDSSAVLVVSVAAADARRVVSALDLDGAVIRVGVLADGQAPDPVATDLTSCAGSGR
jgi:hypothetical protein